MRNKKGEGELAVFVEVAFILMLLVAGIFGMKAMGPWWARTTGKSELARAEQNRQIAVLEAQAEKEAAVLKKDTDIIRAEGVAEANEIIAKSLTPEYIRWKWVEGLHDGSSEVIYIPTETGLPITEAVRKS